MPTSARGETGRTLATRMKDHTSHNTQPTAVGGGGEDHCREHGHVIRKNNVEVPAREEGWFSAGSVKPSKSRPDSQPSTEIRDSICPRSTANYYRSHVIVMSSGQLARWSGRECLRKLANQAKHRLWKVSYFSNIRIHFYAATTHNTTLEMNRTKKDDVYY